MIGINSQGYEFTSSESSPNIIKVLGVGGGGSNAVKHMYQQGIKGVDFIITNTDKQALQASNVPIRMQLGSVLTGGLGAGSLPETGRQAAEESMEEIRALLNDGTKMVFITAGMGGGTGTGAAPVIAKICRELNVLTVGIVTLPFFFEGPKKLKKAHAGIIELKKYCDTVLVIVNDKLREMFGELSLREAFSHADTILSTAAKSIAEIITINHDINVDFNDVYNAMKDSGTAVMGSATASGPNRAAEAARNAITSPLLDNREIKGASKVLLSILAGPDRELTIQEFNEICAFVQGEAGDEADMKFGTGVDPDMGDAVRVTIIATGFATEEEWSVDGKVQAVAQPAPAPVVEAPAPAPVYSEPTYAPQPVAQTPVASPAPVFQPEAGYVQQPVAPAPQEQVYVQQPVAPAEQHYVQQPVYQQAQPQQQQGQPFYAAPTEGSQVPPAAPAPAPGMPPLTGFVQSQQVAQPVQQPVQQVAPQQVVRQPVPQQVQQPMQPVAQPVQQATPQPVQQPTYAQPEYMAPVPTPMPEQTQRTVVNLHGQPAKAEPQQEPDHVRDLPQRVRTLQDVASSHTRVRNEALRNLASQSSGADFDPHFSEPAFRRQGMELHDLPTSSHMARKVSRLSVNADSTLGENSYLNNNVD